MKKSFIHTSHGLVYALEESTFKTMSAIALAVAVLALVLEVKPIEAGLLILTVTVVLSLELLNTQVEKTLDILQPKKDQRVRVIKDVSAAAVLIASVGSVFIGLIIFLPYLI